MEQNNYTVYLHISPSGKRYYGITCQDVNLRWHNGEGYKKQMFYRAIKKYGWDNFQHIIVAENLSKEDACALEISLIAVYNTTDSHYGYNIGEGGEHSKCSESTKLKLRKAKLGRKLTEETKRKIAEKSKGHKLPKEAVEKLRAINKGNKIWLGKHHKDESKSKSAKNQPKARKITCDGLIFDSVYDCAKYLNIDKEYLHKVLQGKNCVSKELKDRKLHYADCEILYIERVSKQQNVVCDEMVFSSVKECAKYYSVNSSTMTKWLSGINKMPKEFVEKNLHYEPVILYWAKN